MRQSPRPGMHAWDQELSDFERLIATLRIHWTIFTENEL